MSKPRLDWEKVKGMSDAEVLPKLGPQPYFDARFPNQNQERACYHYFMDFVKCQKLKGEDFEDCNYFKGVYESICNKKLIEQRIEALQYKENLTERL